MKREYRAVQVMGIEGRTLHGVVLRYNVQSSPLRDEANPETLFVETIAPGAFADSIRAGGVEVQWQHGVARDVLASQATGTLELTDGPDALTFRATLGNTAADDLYLDRVSRGLVREMSFGFSVPDGGDSWSGDRGIMPTRRVLRGVLHEISPVARGAYPGTGVVVRQAQKQENRTMFKNATLAALAAGIATLSLRDGIQRAESIRQAMGDASIDVEDKGLLALAHDEVRERIGSLSQLPARAPAAAPPAGGGQRQQEPESVRWLRETRGLEERTIRLPSPREVRATMGVAISGGTQNFGTAAVQPTLEADFVKSLLGPTALMRLARLTPCSGPYNKPIISGRDDYTTGSAKAEGGAGTDRDFKATTVSFAPTAHAEQYETSLELIEDSAYDVVAEIYDEIAIAQGVWWENQFINSDGTGTKPLGLITAAWTGGAVTSAAASAVLVDECLDLKYKLSPAYYPNAAWLMHPTTWGKLRREKTTGGAYVLDGQRDNTVIDGIQVPTLDGHPVFLSAYMPAPGVSTKSVFFGDFRRAYEIAMRQALTLKRAAEDKTSLTNGTAFFVGTMRMDGRARDLGALAVLTTHA